MKMPRLTEVFRITEIEIDPDFQGPRPENPVGSDKERAAYQAGMNAAYGTVDDKGKNKMKPAPQPQVGDMGNAPQVGSAMGSDDEDPSVLPMSHQYTGVQTSTGGTPFAPRNTHSPEVGGTFSGPEGSAKPPGVDAPSAAATPGAKAAADAEAQNQSDDSTYPYYSYRHRDPFRDPAKDSLKKNAKGAIGNMAGSMVRAFGAAGGRGQ